MSAVRGSVQLPVGGMELITRYSLNSLRHGSIMSSLEDFKDQERLSINDKQFNWKLLRDQFKQRNMESLYRLYDDKLRLGYLSMFLMIQLIISIVHLVTLEISMGMSKPQEIVPIICYVIQAFVPIPIIAVLFVSKFTKKYKSLQLILSVLMLSILLALDVLVPILSTIEPRLRPAYYTNTLLSCYIFLPIRKNGIALLIGVIISLCHLAVMWTVTYSDITNYNNKYKELGGDLLYLIGVNILGLYYRMMNEIVSRRSFLDRRACVESTLKLNFEKDQEERLLLSILPLHIASTIRDDIQSIFKHIQSQNDAPISTFQHLYINEHDNVSILYADVVNYTMITTTLAPKVLIETLNELFGRFDEASEEHDVLRIKFLGDCYYCVSGVPKPNPQHAKSCVDLGLEMISIIKDVRESRRLNIDMRIGVHSGKILSGLIGIRKWQYDIWSKDVTIANRMESTGKAGKVHITNKTLEELSDSAQDYIIEPNFESRNDPILSKYKLQTFLISNPSRESVDYADHRIQYRRASVASKIKKKGAHKPRIIENSGIATIRSRTTAFIDNNLMAYRQMIRTADQQMTSVIEEMPSGILSEYTKEDTMSPWTLLFRNREWEASFIKQPDLLFKYFIAASLCILILMMSIQVLTIRVLTWKVLIIDGTLAVILIILQPLNWTKFFYERVHGKEEPKNKILLFFYNKSQYIVWSPVTRSVLYCFVICMLAVISLINLSQCDDTAGSDDNCILPWQLTQVCFLGILLSFLFSRVFFIIKWAIGILITAIYIWIVWDLKTDVFLHGTSWNNNMDSRVAQTLAIVFITITLHMLDRQTEFRSRLDHRWKTQLTEKQENASTMKIVNNMLLNNILPAHVADIYLNTSRSPEELYFEEYAKVSVMFASLTDYKFSSDDDDDEQGMLKYLNQLISDFDKLLLSENDKRLKVEKIKMAGWTYMAACGLDPCHRESIVSSTSSDMMISSTNSGPIYVNNTYEDDVVLTMVQFAVSMMQTLGNFNKCSFQGINLKVGMSHGEITAGVVGSSKPLYDIWGNAVNMASRMDSTGEPGKIQVTEKTALVLDRQGVITQYRGETFVKGVGYVRTYFVPLDKDFNLHFKRKESLNLNSNEVTKF